MGKLENYRVYIQQLLRKYGSYKSRYGDFETEMIFDTERDHYQLVHVGWEDNTRVYGCAMHLDIKDDKIWIQWNGTEIDIADELVEMGVPKHDIVLGFHPPNLRKFTEYAVG